MSQKDVRVYNRTRERSNELADSSPPTKKSPLKANNSEDLQTADEDERSHEEEDENLSDVEHHSPTKVFALQNGEFQAPKLSPKTQLRSSHRHLLVTDSPRRGSRMARQQEKLQERRDSLLGWSHPSPPGSPQGAQPSNLGAYSFTSSYQDFTDSEDDIPPPITQPHHIAHSQPQHSSQVRIRPSSVPINTLNARKLIVNSRERKTAQERDTPKIGTRTLPQSPVTPQRPEPFFLDSIDSRPKHYRLERGGVVVATSLGPIQFGIPPETIKDSLSQGFVVPQMFVVPKDRFDTVVGLNMCEVEFPGYYQFFIKNRSCTLICSKEAEISIRKIMHEILQGPPAAHLYTDEECVAEFDARPNHVEEMKFFVRPREGRTIEVDSLFRFITFTNVEEFEEVETYAEEEVVAVVKLGEGVEIHETVKEWIVYDNEEEVARIEFWLASMVPPRFPHAMVLPTKTFVPPVLGVTVLGSSHGFDPKQSTSGFVLWMHGRGIMVDPPPNATDLLKSKGISPRLISAIILTHCHADHDAGTFQKILVEGRVTILTTKTIMAMFLRKYSRISGFTEAFLCRLFEPRVVKIGEDVFFSGGIIRFFYSFHALPCIGFQVFVAGKSIAYSADTLYDPAELNKLCEEGVLSEGRKNSLLSFPFETATLVIHEAGIPPIHTPVSVLNALSENAKSRLWIIHVSEKVAEDSGLRLARAGTDQTICVVSDSDPYSYMLDVITNSELFFPYLASKNKFGRGIVSAAQDRSVNTDVPHHLDFSFLDIAIHNRRFSTGSHVDRKHAPRSSNLMDQMHRDSDLSYGSMKRNSGGYDSMSPIRGGAPITARRTSQSTTKSLAFSSDYEEEDFSVPQVADLLRMSTKLHYEAGTLVSAKAGSGDNGLYLIIKGFCRVERPTSSAYFDEKLAQPAEGPPGTILEPGDCFGLMIVNEHRENTLLRRTEIKTLTEVDLCLIDLNSLWYMLNVYPALERRLARMHELRALEAWKTMELNSCLRRLASFQRTQLNAVLETKNYKVGDELWSKKPGPRHAFLVLEGQLVFSEIEETHERPFEAGAFLCDFHSIIRRAPNPSMFDVDHNNTFESKQSDNEALSQAIPTVTLIAKTDCRVYQINWKDAFLFLESNPGVLVQIYHSYVVE